MKIAEIAEKLGAKIIAADTAANDVAIQKLAPIDKAGPGDISFIANPDYFKFASTTQASALLLRDALAECRAIQLIVPDPYMAFARLAQLFYRAPTLPEGISTQAYIAPDSVIGKNVTIAPGVYISAKVTVGDNVTLYPGVFLGEGASIGEHSVLHANTVVYHGCKVGRRCILHANVVIGADGFGYAVNKTETVKIPQVGIAVIEDDVEIGACSSVDRAAMGVTRVGQGSKIDNHVQLGHNVELGQRCMLSAFVGIAGSAKLGDRVTVGGHTGINGHIKIASDNRIGAMSGVVKSIETSGGEYVGFPAVPAMQWRRAQIYQSRLGDIDKRLRALEKSATQSG